MLILTKRKIRKGTNPTVNTVSIIFNNNPITFFYFVLEIRKEEVLAIRNRFPTKIPVSRFNPT